MDVEGLRLNGMELANKEGAWKQKEEELKAARLKCEKLQERKEAQEVVLERSKQEEKMIAEQTARLTP